jgi:hypothetical protein
MTDQDLMTAPADHEPEADTTEIEVHQTDDPLAEEHEKRVRDEKKVQFKKLKDNAQVIFGRVNGRPGIRSPEQWAEVMETLTACFIDALDI